MNVIHTPTPWYVEEVKGADDIYVSNDDVHIGRIFDHEDAAYIVKAVNAHQDLVNALKGMLEYAGLIEERCDSAATNAARAALAAAGEPV